MRGRLTLVMVALLFGASASLAQEVGDEKEPELRAELLQLLGDDQNARAEFDEYRKRHGLLDLDEKTLNEKLNKNRKLKAGFQALSLRLQEGEDARLLRVKQILVTYGWPGRTLVGTEAANSAYLIVSHSQDLPLQKLSLELMTKLGTTEVQGQQIATLTDRILLAEGKKQRYGQMYSFAADGTPIPKPIEDEANVDKRRAALGQQPPAEIIRRSNKAILGK